MDTAEDKRNELKQGKVKTGVRIHGSWRMIPQTQIAKSVYSAENLHAGVLHAPGWKTEAGLYRDNLKPVRVGVADFYLPFPWLVGSIFKGRFGGLLLINYTWLKLGGEAASTASDWIPTKLTQGRWWDSFLIGCLWWVVFPGIDLFWTFPVLGNRNLGLVSQTASLQPVAESVLSLLARSSHGGCGNV